MDAPAYRPRSITLALAVAGVLAVSAAVAVVASAGPAPAPLEAAAGSVLSVQATPQPPAVLAAVKAAAGPLAVLAEGISGEPAATPTPAPTAAARPAARRASTAASKARASTTAAAYDGVNHVWIPALGINRAVYAYACSRATALDHVVYRWGCGGRNNVYLMGHASSVFQPLAAAYSANRLTVGMKVYYADATGTVRLYTVRWWKLTRPTTDAKWAWAAQNAPSMTLQTCIGAKSQYRLMVRLVQAGR